MKIVNAVVVLSAAGLLGVAKAGAVVSDVKVVQDPGTCQVAVDYALSERAIVTASRSSRKSEGSALKSASAVRGPPSLSDQESNARSASRKIASTVRPLAQGILFISSEPPP